MANGLFNLKQVVQAVQQGAWAAQKPPAVEYLVVAGGGGGGGYAPGGGGGLLQGIDLVPNGQTLLVTVGAGGTNSPTNGGNSVFGSVTSVGGGRPAFPAVTGGSGGGGPNGPTTNAIGLPGQATVGQGNTGGYGRDTGASYYGGGGGGAGTTGYAANNGICGTGGAGIASVISGTVTAYAGGGGGGHAYGGNPGAGGVGGGGAGGDAVNPTPANGYPGTANTGGGGGAASYNGVGANAGAGGSGIVIISYPDVYAAAASSSGATVSTSGSGSYSNNGSLSYLNYGNQTALHLGSGSFTVEMWLYKNANTPVMTACGDLLSGSTNTFCIMGDASTGTKITWYDGAAGAFILTSTTSLATGTWYHVAFVRNSSTITLYINGVSEAVATLTTNYNATTSFFVGQTPEAISGRSWNGNISNFRMVKGTAVYTSNFTPSTTPLTAIASTSLLLNTVSGAPFADGSGNGFAPAGVGTPAWNQLSPFTVTGYKNRVYTWTSSGSITF